MFLSVLIYLCSYLTWGSYEVSFFRGSITAKYFPYIGSQSTVALDGWHGTLKLFGVMLDNWHVPAAAALLAVLAVLRALALFDRHSHLSMALAFYGTLHSGYVVYVLFNGGKLGPGAAVSAIFFVIIMFVLLKEMRNVTSGGSGNAKREVRIAIR